MLINVISVFFLIVYFVNGVLIVIDLNVFVLIGVVVVKLKIVIFVGVLIVSVFVFNLKIFVGFIVI